MGKEVHMKGTLRFLLILFAILCCSTISSARIQEAQEGAVFEKARILGSEVGFRADFIASKTGPAKFDVGPYDQMRGQVSGLDAHYVGQKTVMKKFIPDYDLNPAPTILVPKIGHTIKGPNGIVSRSTKGLGSARDVVARDIREMRRVYPDAPNSKLQELIQANKTQYPDAFKKK